MARKFKRVQAKKLVKSNNSKKIYFLKALMNIVRLITEISRKMSLKGKLNKAFRHFCQIFWAYLIIFSKFRNTYSALYFEKSSNMVQKLAKNDEKLCLTCLKPISLWHFQNPKPRFWIPDPSLLD